MHTNYSAMTSHLHEQMELQNLDNMYMCKQYLYMYLQRAKYWHMKASESL